MTQLPYSISSRTPIVTGDNDHRNTELQAAGLLGSLRYQYWLLKAMQAWEKNPQHPVYPPYSADLSPAGSKNFTEELRKAGPVVQLFGATNWKKMFRLEIAEAVQREQQSCSARANDRIAPWQWTFKLIFRHDRNSPIFNKLADKEGFSLADELHSLMAFVHQYGWLGAAPQNGLGWVKVQSEELGTVILPQENPVFAAKDILLNRKESKRLQDTLRDYYRDKYSNLAAPHWKRGRYLHSLEHLDKQSPPIGYEIRRWLRDQMFPPDRYKNKQEEYFGNQKHAGFVHVTHPVVQSDGGWLLRLRFAARPDTTGDTTRLYPDHLDIAPQFWLDYCEKLLKAKDD
ncbi:hypothetical protein GCAAIG_02030 [Candidatus Electronema halotolerans]